MKQLLLTATAGHARPSDVSLRPVTPRNIDHDHTAAPAATPAVMRSVLMLPLHGPHVLDESRCELAEPAEQRRQACGMRKTARTACSFCCCIMLFIIIICIMSVFAATGAGAGACSTTVCGAGAGAGAGASNV